MKITSEQAYKWADDHRRKIIQNIEYLIEELEQAKGWLVKGNGYTVDGNPETTLKQIRKEQFKAESLAELADHIRYNEAVEKAKAEG
jgi:hypothetical protein